MFNSLTIKKYLLVLMAGWIVLLSGLVAVQERPLKVDPDNRGGISQDILDEAGVSANHKIHLTRLERKLSEKPVIRDEERAAKAAGPVYRILLARVVPGDSFLQRRSRGPPVRFA